MVLYMCEDIISKSYCVIGHGKLQFSMSFYIYNF